MIPFARDARHRRSAGLTRSIPGQGPAKLLTEPLFRAEFLVLEGLFRFTKLEFNLLAFLNLANPF
jgi:hypothetical protein